MGLVVVVDLVLCNKEQRLSIDNHLKPHFTNNESESINPYNINSTHQKLQYSGDTIIATTAKLGQL